MSPITRTVRRHLTYANVVATICLLVLVATPAAAAIRATITGAHVKNSTLTGIDVKDGALAGIDVKNSSLTGADVKDFSITSNDLAPGVVRNGTDGVDGEDGAPGTPADTSKVWGAMSVIADGVGTNNVRFVSLAGDSTADAVEDFVMPLSFGRAVELSTLRFSSPRLLPDADDELTFTLRRNGADVASCTAGLDDADPACAVAGPIPISAGDRVTVKIVGSGNPAAEDASVSWLVRPT